MYALSYVLYVYVVLYCRYGCWCWCLKSVKGSIGIIVINRCKKLRRLIGILPQYTLNNLVDCSIFLGDSWVTLWYTWETAETSLYTFRILGRLRILIRILKNFISGYVAMKYISIFDKNLWTIFHLQWKIGNISDMFLHDSVLCGFTFDVSSFVFKVHISENCSPK